MKLFLGVCTVSKKSVAIDAIHHIGRPRTAGLFDLPHHTGRHRIANQPIPPIACAIYHCRVKCSSFPSCYPENP
ncbi:hypothetical protein PoMZ_09088 [Pyricularia oryzae]|uniref:Uncharacterized protein n=1 Tax=Pyricularia oryzae TaxID=318829 RepID=A0A4P7N0U9_PYROR|nr:hypothetical protein PoMZ_09088 [Pyricularia oryzae]